MILISYAALIVLGALHYLLLAQTSVGYGAATVSAIAAGILMGIFSYAVTKRRFALQSKALSFHAWTQLSLLAVATGGIMLQFNMIALAQNPPRTPIISLLLYFLMIGLAAYGLEAYQRAITNAKPPRS